MIIHITPALIQKSLRANVRGHKSHLPIGFIAPFLLAYWENGKFPAITAEDLAEVKKIQRKNAVGVKNLRAAYAANAAKKVKAARA